MALPRDNLGRKLIRLAEKLADAALDDSMDDSHDQRVETLKVTGNFYTATRRVKGGDDDEPASGSFSAIRKAIASAEGHA